MTTSYTEVPVKGIPSKPPDAARAPVTTPATPAATPTTTRTNPVTPKVAAITALAKMMNGPAFERALDDPEPRKLGPSDTWEVSQSLWESSSAMWADLVDRFRLKGDLLTFRPLIYNEAFEDQETTGCAELNNDNSTVKSSSPLPFYCQSDGDNGTLYWPIKTLEKEWEAADDVSSDFILRGLEIMMNQRIGQAIAVKAYDTYEGMPDADSVPRPMPSRTEALGYCFAGTALQGSYFDRETVLNSLAFVYPAHDANQVLFARALAFGFDTNSLGKCMVEFWPR